MIDCMGCIANAVAGIPHVDDATEWTLDGVGHGVYVSERDAGVHTHHGATRFKLCEFRMERNGYWRQHHGHIIPQPYDGTGPARWRARTPDGVIHGLRRDSSDTHCGLDTRPGGALTLYTRTYVDCQECALKERTHGR